MERMQKPSCQKDFVLLLLVFFCFLNLRFTASTSPHHLCSYDQGHALLDFKKNFIITSDVVALMCSDFSSSQPRTDSWHQGQDCCYWDGVTCDQINGHVIGLDLSCSGLQGQLSSNSTLFLLQHLEILNLAGNNFNWSEIPPEVGHLRRLTHLDLSHAYFSGQVPIQISYLSNLVSLDLSTADYDGNLTVTRPAMTNIVQNLTNLKQLHLGNVDISLAGSQSLRNLSSSLTSLLLTLSGLNGIFPTSIFHLPNLQAVSLSSVWNLQISFPTSNWTISSLRELHIAGGHFTKELWSSIANLKSLKYLTINECGISASIPDSIGNLTSMEHLDLGDNEIAGSIPESMYSLPLLRYLDISSNQYTSAHLHPFHSGALESIYLGDCGLQGSIPATLFPHGANQLTVLDFGLNSLNGTIPPSLLTLPSLLYLDLSYNQLLGAIPEFMCTSLKQLKLSGNQLQGSIPSSIFNLANLTGLYFASNNLSGTMDSSLFSKLQSLENVYGSNNSLSFTAANMNLSHSLPNLEDFYFSSNNVSEFPIFLRGSKVLTLVDLSNNVIDGCVPDWFLDVGRDTLYYLNLAHNHLTRIDKLLWTNLQYIDLHSNLLQGPLPLPPSSWIMYLISHNSLTGDIPALICKARSMEAFDASRNSFTGTIPECLGNLSTLTVLDLSMNKLQGKIPNFHNSSSLRTLQLNQNQLEGKLPKSLRSCKSLEVMDIGKNAINDTFPHWLRNLTELQVLVLKANNFHGKIHAYKYPNSFQKLRIFDVSDNNFVGSLPTNYIQYLQAMKEDTLGTNDSKYMQSYLGDPMGSYYQDSTSLTVKGNEMAIEKILRTFMTIDFSNNNFGGELPQVIGALINLKSLNVSGNNLVGHIPASVGNLRSLESLDLSSNKLSGTIPSELASLTFLGKLNLSQNALVGPIPSAKNFDTRFDNSSYQENLALCGSPLSRTCSNKNNNKPPPALHEDEGSDDFDKKIILYGYISGFVIGVSIGYMVLSGELPIWLLKMIQGYKLRKLKRQIQRSRGTNQ